MKWNVKPSPKLLPCANFLWNVNRYKGVCDHLKKEKQSSFGKEWNQKSGEELFLTLLHRDQTSKLVCFCVKTWDVSKSLSKESEELQFPAEVSAERCVGVGFGT